jgi:hypothetical protein
VRTAAVGARVAWDTLYLLELYGALVWDSSPAPVQKAAAVVVEDDPWRAFENKDYFSVLGLHWSTTPSEIGPAYTRLRSEFGPGGLRHPKDRETANKILKLLDDAHKTLSNDSERRKYRQSHFNLVWPHQAQLLVAKAKLSLYRKDLVEARNTLLAAQDLAPSHEAAELLAAIARAKQ